MGARSKVRSKIRFTDAVEEQPEPVQEEAETQAPPTAGRGRTRSRFGGTRTRVSTGKCSKTLQYDIFTDNLLIVPPCQDPE